MLYPAELRGHYGISMAYESCSLGHLLLGYGMATAVVDPSRRRRISRVAARDNLTSGKRGQPALVRKRAFLGMVETDGVGSNQTL